MTSASGLRPLNRNLLSLAGAAVASLSAILLLTLLTLESVGALSNPYLGLLTFIALPFALLVGLLLIPLGMWRERRLRRRFPDRPAREWPVIDLRDPRQRNVLLAVSALTLVNLLLVSVATYGGVHYMESAEFCGRVCHTTMEPQFTAYQNASHSRVACIDCHVGPGAQALVESKLAGVRQLIHVVTNQVPKPVPSPVASMRPARDTCEQCHWPEKMHGDRARIVREFVSDEANTELTTRLTLHVGGGSPGTAGTGIHWHMNLENDIEYVAADRSRAEILWVSLRDRSGRVVEFVADGATPEAIAAGERRRMDCMDCHNRPAHRFDASPERAVDRALAEERLPVQLPFLRREAVAALTVPYASHDEAGAGIAERLRSFYADRQMAAPAELVERAIASTSALYRRNVFPAMAVTWGTYPSVLGHTDAPGCFRCHDELHRAANGRVIRQDCGLCHTEPE